MKLLKKMQSPKDLQGLPLDELPKLATEIRGRIIEVMAEIGGHLSSNLGSVELTLAMHYVFNSPEDLFIWDVGHQTYPHKLLTGRQEGFSQIRQYQGLCGFTDPKESEHDHFHAGHAGPALSSALGVAKSRDLKGEDHFVVPVIGDASLTCGLTLEALNNMPRELKRFVVILNDNKMSISKNVGAIKGVLSRLLSNPSTNWIFQEMDQVVSKIPSYGSLISESGKTLTGSLKNLVSPGAFFEHFNLSYIGPVDGHDVKTLIETLEGVKNSRWPVIIHAITEKGHGMTDPMRKTAINWHGAKPFDPKTGKPIAKSGAKPTFPKVFGKHLLEMSDKNDDLVTVTPAMSLGSCLDPVMEKYPERCIDVGIAEGHAVTYAGGIAQSGRPVFMSIYATFLQRALDNLFHDVCLQEIPLVLAIDRGGIAGGDGYTHNGVYDIAWLNAMPGMIICQPRDGQVLKELMESCFEWEAPAAIRYPNLPTEVNESPLARRTPGQGEVLAIGDDVLIVALGHHVKTAFGVREELASLGVRATILDPVFVKPLDEELLRRLLIKHKRIVTIEEHSLKGGLGSIINDFLMQNGFRHVSVVNCGIPDRFIAHGKHGKLLEEIGLTSRAITQKVAKAFAFDLEASVHL